MLDIAFVNETNYVIDDYKELITNLFFEVIKQENIDKYYEISVVFVTKEKIQEINKQYRSIDQVTDVISFALLEGNYNHYDNITTLGDIFICIEKMKEQAIEYNHSESRELAFLSCHGLLHLLGYDHDNEVNEKIMFKKQKQILNILNIKRKGI